MNMIKLDSDKSKHVDENTVFIEYKGLPFIVLKELHRKENVIQEESVGVIL